MRLDLYLKQEHKLSRQKAQDLIQKSAVKVNDKIVTKAAFEVNKQDKVVILDHDILKYVSRAGLKLEAAIADLGINVKGFMVLDLGQSTGGFSDCLLQHGASKVVGIDVGHGQIHPSLKEKNNLICHENFHLKDLKPEALKDLGIDQAIDLIVGDLSFISTLKHLDLISKLMNKQSHLLILIKPQFELGAQFLNKNGIVKDKLMYLDVEKECKKSVPQAGLEMLDYFPSTIEGKDGNQEFFLYAKKNLNN